jgi:plasmid replication initiation protein
VTREINKSSDIEITPEFKKKGRSISEIRFLINANPQLPLMDIDDDDSVKGLPVYKRLMALGISHKLAQQWIVTHGEDYVRDKLDYTSNQNKQGRIRGSVSGFINAAIKNDYKTEKTVQKAAVEVRKQASVEKVKAEAQAFLQEAALSQEKLERARRGEELSGWLESLDAQDREQLLADFAKTLDKDFLKADFAKLGLKAPLIIDRFDAYVSSLEVGAV